MGSKPSGGYSDHFPVTWINNQIQTRCVLWNAIEFIEWLNCSL